MKTVNVQQLFAERVISIVRKDSSVAGLAVAGSWLTEELDEFSDLDLILVTEEKVSIDILKMKRYAASYGDLLSAFTGEHIGEPRLLICLYKDPFLHVDIKFMTLSELDKGIEQPTILYDTKNRLREAFSNAKIQFPYPDYQWIEDRFWVWVHYLLLKVGRGEYMEANDFLAFLRMKVFGPLLHIKNGNLPRGVRKVETQLAEDDLGKLRSTIGANDRQSLLAAAAYSIQLYRHLSAILYPAEIYLNTQTEREILKFLTELQMRFLKQNEDDTI